MVTERQKHKQYSAQEIDELLAANKHRVIPQKQWCKEHGIAVSTLHKWLNSDKEQPASQSKQTWASVVVSSPAKESTLLLQAGKLSIAVEKDTDMELLSAVLSILVALC